MSQSLRHKYRFTETDIFDIDHTLSNSTIEDHKARSHCVSATFTIGAKDRDANLTPWRFQVTFSMLEIEVTSISPIIGTSALIYPWNWIKDQWRYMKQDKHFSRYFSELTDLKNFLDQSAESVLKSILFKRMDTPESSISYRESCGNPHVRFFTIGECIFKLDAMAYSVYHDNGLQPKVGEPYTVLYIDATSYKNKELDCRHNYDSEFDPTNSIQIAFPEYKYWTIQYNSKRQINVTFMPSGYESPTYKNLYQYDEL